MSSSTRVNPTKASPPKSSDKGGSGLNAWQRVNRGRSTFDFVGRWRRWLALSMLVIVIGFAFVGFRGLKFSIDFKGGTVWDLPSTASVAHVRDTVGGVSPTLRQATIQVLANRQTGKQTVQVEATTKQSTGSGEVAQVTAALARMAKVSTNQVNVNSIGPSWGQDITTKAVRALIVFFVVIAVFVWFWFEPKMAVAALTAVVHDILVTIGIYAVSGFQVSPDTVIAFLTILGYSLYDTIVVFDKVAENDKNLGASGKLTYTELVNLSMNQVLARSINTSLVAILPILSILVIGGGILGASALNDFGLALFIGLTTGAYSSLFIASPMLALLKEREPRWAQVRERVGRRSTRSAISPAALAARGLSELSTPGGRSGRRPQRSSSRGAHSLDALAPETSYDKIPGDSSGEGSSTAVASEWESDDGERLDQRPGGPGPDGARSGAPRASAGAHAANRPAGPASRPATGSPSGGSTGNRPPPRPRKKGRRR